MKYKIVKSYIRKYATESEIPIATVVVKYKLLSGYVGKLELPTGLTSQKWVEEAIKKDIENARKICKGEV